MAVPTEYTNKSLAEYMYNIVASAIADTGWTVGAVGDDDDAGSFQEPINDVLLEMGLTDASQIEADDIAEVRIRARAAVWLAVVEEKVPLYDAGGMAHTLSRSQIFQHAYAMLQRADTKLAALVNAQQLQLIGGVPMSASARIRPVWGTDDPYNADD